MNLVELLETIFTNKTLIKFINKPPIIFPAEEYDEIFNSSQPNVTLDLENSKFPFIMIEIRNSILNLDFNLDIAINDDFLLIKDKKFDGNWGFVSYKPEVLDNYDEQQFRNIERETAHLGANSDLGLINHLNSLKMGKYIPKLDLRNKEKYQTFFSMEDIVLPIRIHRSKSKYSTDILISSFMKKDKIDFNIFIPIANEIAYEIIYYKSNFP